MLTKVIFCLNCWSYLWTGSVNDIKHEAEGFWSCKARHWRRRAVLWATWLFYAVLIDLYDEVADELTLPFDSISIEMDFRGIYHFYL